MFDSYETITNLLYKLWFCNRVQDVHTLYLNVYDVHIRIDLGSSPLI